jgi:hypothetical protein
MGEALNWRGFKLMISIINYSFLLYCINYIIIYLSIFHVSGRIAQWSIVPPDIPWFWVRTRPFPRCMIIFTVIDNSLFVNLSKYI